MKGARANVSTPGGFMSRPSTSADGDDDSDGDLGDSPYAPAAQAHFSFGAQFAGSQGLNSTPRGSGNNDDASPRLNESDKAAENQERVRRRLKTSKMYADYY